MEVLIAGCAGLDVHNYSVEACVRKAGTEGQVSQTTRQWGTTTRQLMAMADWLQAEGVTDVAMESTGVYWKPIFNGREREFEVLVLLVNARSISTCPDARPTCKTASGSRNCCSTGCRREVSSPRAGSGNGVT
jgi:transposase